MVVPGKQRDLESETRFFSPLKPLNVVIKEIAADVCKKDKPTPKNQQINHKTKPSWAGKHRHSWGFSALQML